MEAFQIDENRSNRARPVAGGVADGAPAILGFFTVSCISQKRSIMLKMPACWREPVAVRPSRSAARAMSDVSALSALADDEDEYAVLLVMFVQMAASLRDEMRNIDDRHGVRALDPQTLSRRQLFQRPSGSQCRQRTFEPAQIEEDILGHGHGCRCRLSGGLTQRVPQRGSGGKSSGSQGSLQATKAVFKRSLPAANSPSRLADL